MLEWPARLAKEKPAVSAKVSSKPQPTHAERLAELERRFQSVRAEAALASEKDRLEDYESSVPQLVTLTKKVRDFGYLFEPDLEANCLRLRTTWIRVKPDLTKELEHQAQQLAHSVKGLEVLMRGARQSGPAQPAALDRLETSLGDIEDKVATAQRAIHGLYDSFASDLSTFRSHLQRLSWTMEQAAESALDWLPTEAVLRAVRANWLRNPGDGPGGVLYLTDQRLLFEQKEDIATKKVLFITTEKKRVQQALLAAPLTTISNVKASNEGLLGHEDHLYLSFDAQGPTPSAHLHLDGQECDEWQAAIRRAQRREFDAQRIKPVSEAEIERLRSAPTTCSACSAALRDPILRGQVEIICSYCASVTRF
jgi:hypothetical protein